MILAGIDEAGYGPVLGPLVVGCCAFEIPDEVFDPVNPPCLWTRLGKLVSRNRIKSGRKLHINDSKKVYSPSGGLKELERSVLILNALARGWCEDLDALLASVSAHAAADLAEHAWYRRSADEAFPLEQDGLSLKLFANALDHEMKRTRTRCVHLAARVLPERRLNRMLAATRNKGSVLFSTAAIHLDHLLRMQGHQPMLIVCDRHGGRGHYGSLLRTMFPDWQLCIDDEAEARSQYTLTGAAGAATIVFTEQAESQSLPVAVASMLSKYLREALMRRFNAWWRGQQPGLAPTAGYYTDGMRFLKDIAAVRQRLGISSDQLIRIR